MELEDLASRFNSVRMNGRGFTAQCPAHDDRSPSLTVARGETGWLVKCYTGCSFLDIARAAGLSPLAFKFGGASSSSSLAGSPLAARRKLASLIQSTRRIPHRLDEIADITLSPTVEELALAGVKYPELAGLPIREAMKMHIVVMDGYVWELVKDRWREFGDDWVEAKRTIARMIWETSQRERSALAD